MPAKLAAPPDGVLFQEYLRDDPFWMLVACQLVNLTTWTAARGPFEDLRGSHPDADHVAAAPLEALVDLIRPLGLYNRRAKSLRAMARWFTARRPVTAEDVLLLPGCGKYAADSWALFIEGRSDVSPNDGKLNWYVLQKGKAVDATQGLQIQCGATLRHD